MNIGLFTDTYYPELNGVANSVYLLKKELEKKGHNVYVVTTKVPGAVDDDPKVFRVPSKAVSFVPERRLGLFYYPKIARQIHKMKLDIIHTHTEFSIGVFGRIMAHELFVPVVHTYHTIYEDYTHYIKKYLSNEERAKKFVKMYSKFSVRGAEELIVPTQKVADLMTRYQVKPDINVIPTGIDLNRFAKKDSLAARNQLKEKLGIPAGDKVVLYLGRVSEEKNIDEVMGYLNSCMEMNHHIHFLIVGDGPHKNALEKTAKTMSQSENIIFAGARPWDEIAHYYQLADVFVSASTSETQGLTYIEALASGIPILAKKDPCLEGVLEDGYNGYAFENKKEFVSGLRKLLWNEEAIDYSANAKESVLKFSTEEFAAKVENIYYHVITSHRNILVRMANKVADKIGYEHTGVKHLGGDLSMNLGNSDMDASKIALGCMRMEKLSVDEASRLVNIALEEGITLFDHADIYGGGQSETIFGKILEQNQGIRDRIRLQTKCGICPGYYDLSKEHIIDSVEQSLLRLRTDYVDLLLLHRPDALMEPDEIAEAFYLLQKSGKVKQFGVSNFNATQISLLQSACSQSILVNQMQLSIAHAGMISQGLETNTISDGSIVRDMGVLDYCREHHITIQTWSPLQYGMFRGSFIDNEKFAKLNEVLGRIANQWQVTKSAVAIAWLLYHPAQFQVIIGTMNVDHLKESCQADHVALTKQEWYEIYLAAGYTLP